METLSEAIDYVKENRNKGVDCPVCRQHCKLYRRKLNSGMARMMKTLYDFDSQSMGKPIHVSKRLLSEKVNAVAQEYSKLKYWGLIIEGEESGTWTVTRKGRDFVDGLITIPRTVFVYNAEPEGFSLEHTTFEEALRDNFKMSEI